MEMAPAEVRSHAEVWTLSRRWGGFLQDIKFALPLLVVDVVVSFALLVGVWQFTRSFLDHSLSSQLALTGLVQTVLLGLCFTAFGLYRNLGMHPVQELERVVTATSFAYLGLAALVAWSPSTSLLSELGVVLFSGCCCLIVLPSLRHLARCYLGRSPWWRKPLIVISRSDRADAFIEELNKERHLGWRPIGFIQEFRDSWHRDHLSKLCLGDEDDLPRIIERNNVFWAILDTENLRPREIQEFIDRYHEALPHLLTVASLRGDTGLFSLGSSCGYYPAVHYPSFHALLIPRSLKRFVDILAAGAALVVLCPLFLLVACLIKISSPGHIFYSQQRLGIAGRPFRIWKFRSMVVNADQVLKNCLAHDPALRDEWRRTQKLAKDPRVTWVGRLLRKTSLDELPQLWNVLNGTMSLVGPRPIVHSEIAKYGDVYRLYARTKPGITGMWQVSGRNLTSYEERLRLDSFYVRNWSIWLDWYILLKTIRVVIFCEGAY
jgi:Undecaprenyl-phosphate galactose phosphotransferase WbaP